LLLSSPIAVGEHPPVAETWRPDIHVYRASAGGVRSWCVLSRHASLFDSLDDQDIELIAILGRMRTRRTATQ
jgi:hypothetical protein